NPAEVLLRPRVVRDGAELLAGHRWEDREESVRGAGDPHVFADPSRGERWRGDDDRALVVADGKARVVEPDLQPLMDIDLLGVDGGDHRDGMKVVQAGPRRVRHFDPAAGGCASPAPDDQVDPDPVRALDDQLLRDGRATAASGNPGDGQTRSGQKTRVFGRI